MSQIAKSFLNKKNNLNKVIAVEDIDLENISIEDLVLKKDESNFDEFINLRSLLDVVSSCQISDAFNTLTRRSGVIKEIKSVNRLKGYGRILTCKTDSDDWGTSILAVDEASEGDVLFIKTNNSDAAIWGELASTYAKHNGVKATVVYGSVRDLDALYNLDFPIFSSNYVSNAGLPLGLGEIKEDLVIGDMVIDNGDFIFGDESGVIVIPKKFFADVMRETLAVKIKESKIIDSLNEGKSLSEIVGLKKKIE